MKRNEDGTIGPTHVTSEGIELEPGPDELEVRLDQMEQQLAGLLQMFLDLKHGPDYGNEDDCLPPDSACSRSSCPCSSRAGT